MLLCSPAKIPMFLETENGSFEAKGLFGALVNLYIKFTSKKYNTTIKFVAYPGFGDKETSSDAYSGCFGQVQRGEADSIFSLVDYPMNIVNISQGHVLFDDRIGYIGGYPQVEFQPYNFTGTFSSFSVPIWSVVIAFLVLFRILIWIKFKLTVKYYSPEQKKIRRRNYTYRILAHFTGDGEIESNDDTMRVTYITLSLFSFLVLAVFRNLMKTGLVVSMPPLIFENYDDLIKYDIIKPTFMDQLYDFRYFKYAEAGTEEKKLWIWAVEKFGEEEIMTVPTPLNFIDVGLQVANQKRVFFSSLDVLRASLSTMCKLLSRKEQGLKSAIKALGFKRLSKMSFQIYLRFGKNMKWMTKQLILSERSKYSNVFVQIKTRALEHGHIVYIRRGMEKTNLLEQFPVLNDLLGKADPLRRIVAEKCLSSQPQDEERTAHEMSVVTFYSLHALIKILFYLFIAAFFLLAFETFVPQIRGSKPKAHSRNRRSSSHHETEQFIAKSLHTGIGLGEKTNLSWEKALKCPRASRFSSRFRFSLIQHRAFTTWRNGRIHPEPSGRFDPKHISP